MRKLNALCDDRRCHNKFNALTRAYLHQFNGVERQLALLSLYHNVLRRESTTDSPVHSIAETGRSGDVSLQTHHSETTTFERQAVTVTATTPDFHNPNTEIIEISDDEEPTGQEISNPSSQREHTEASSAQSDHRRSTTIERDEMIGFPAADNHIHHGDQFDIETDSGAMLVPALYVDTGDITDEEALTTDIAMVARILRDGIERMSTRPSPPTTASEAMHPIRSPQATPSASDCIDSTDPAEFVTQRSSSADAADPSVMDTLAWDVPDSDDPSFSDNNSNESRTSDEPRSNRQRHEQPRKRGRPDKIRSVATKRRKRRKLNQAYDIGDTLILVGVSFRDILNVAFPLARARQRSKQEAQITELFARLFTTKQSLRSIMSGVRQRPAITRADIDEHGMKALERLKNDPNKSFQGIPQSSYVSLVDQLTIYKLCCMFGNSSMPSNASFCLATRQLESEHGYSMPRYNSFDSLIIGLIHDRELSDQQWERAITHLNWLNKGAESLEILDEQLGNGSIIMLSSTPCRQILSRIKSERLQLAITNLLEVYPGLKDLFKPLETYIGALLSSRRTFKPEQMTFADYLRAEGRHTEFDDICPAPEVSRDSTQQRGRPSHHPLIPVLQEQHSAMHGDYGTPNRAPVADMTGMSE